MTPLLERADIPVMPMLETNCRILTSRLSASSPLIIPLKDASARCRCFAWSVTQPQAGGSAMSWVATLQGAAFSVVEIECLGQQSLSI